MVLDLCIKNGTVFASNRVGLLNIGIQDGKIVEISKSSLNADKIIDARGKIVLPGMVDTHVHFRDPGFKTKEDFHSGTCAAAAGGVTTVIDMPNNKPATDSIVKLKKKNRSVSKKAVVDYGLQLGADKASEIKNLVEGAVKFYMAKSSTLLTTGKKFESCYKAIPETAVACIHAEDEAVIKGNAKEFEKPNFFDHSRIRNIESATSALKFVGTMVRQYGQRTHVCHVSSLRELAMVPERATCEVTPHHLLLTEDEGYRLNNYVKVNPPIRREEDRLALWEALGDGIQVIGSDHAPHLPKEKEAGYAKAPSGVPGVETTLPLMLTKVGEHALPLDLLVKMFAENPASIFTLWNKGAIAPKKDADIVIVNMKAKKVINRDSLFTKCGWSPYEGKEVCGIPEKTLVRGQVVFDQGEVIARKGYGKNVWSLEREEGLD